MPAVGEMVGHKFRVIALLGEGAMGAVYRAENVVTGRHFAIKWMHPKVAERGDAAARLLREAQAASRLNHPNVVEVYDIIHANTTLFLVMELLEGETLRAYLVRNPRPRIAEFIALLLPALDGVAAAHQRGVIHRDLKPENIFIARDRAGRGVIPKVVDFGIAKLAAHGGLTLTDSGVTMGTPLYMSLEQLRGDRSVDERADVYAFGAMLYEAVCGRPPYCANNLPDLAFKIATTDPPQVKAVRPDVPTPLAQLIDRAIARDRDQRLPDIRSLIRQLRAFSREPNFQRQMTNPKATLPRVAPNLLEHADHDAQLDQPVPPPIAANRQPPSTTLEVKREHTADTLAARVLASARLGQHRTSLGGLALALAMVGVGYFWMRQPTESSAKPTAIARPVEVAPSTPLPQSSARPGQAGSPARPVAPEPDHAIADGEASIHGVRSPASVKQLDVESTRAEGATARPARIHAGTRATTRPRRMAASAKPEPRASPAKRAPPSAAGDQSATSTDAVPDPHRPSRKTAAEELAF